MCRWSSAGPESGGRGCCWWRGLRVREGRSLRSRSQISFIVGLGRAWARIGWRLPAAREPRRRLPKSLLAHSGSHHLPLLFSRAFPSCTHHGLPSSPMTCFPPRRAACCRAASPTPRFRSSLQLHRPAFPDHVWIFSLFILSPVLLPLRDNPGRLHAVRRRPFCSSLVL